MITLIQWAFQHTTASLHRLSSLSIDTKDGTRLYAQPHGSHGLTATRRSHGTQWIELASTNGVMRVHVEVAESHDALKQQISKQTTISSSQPPNNLSLTGPVERTPRCQGQLTSRNSAPAGLLRRYGLNRHITSYEIVSAPTPPLSSARESRQLRP